MKIEVIVIDCKLDIITENITKCICTPSKKSIIGIESKINILSKSIIDIECSVGQSILIDYQIDSIIKYKDVSNACIYDINSSTISSVLLSVGENVLSVDNLIINTQIQSEQAVIYNLCDIYKNIVVCICIEEMIS